MEEGSVDIIFFSANHSEKILLLFWIFLDGFSAKKREEETKKDERWMVVRYRFCSIPTRNHFALSGSRNPKLHLPGTHHPEIRRSHNRGRIRCAGNYASH